ncbi:hypothetical protein J4221_05695 [Candidatus Pacearchaeota archaeon]|nr:hypothetical protein [Candidatus Pacearchaeota archaeon]
MENESLNQKEIILQTNPSYIREFNGVYYPVAKIIYDVKGKVRDYDEESPLALELGLDIIETPNRNLKLAAELNNRNPFNTIANICEKARKLAIVSTHDFYSFETDFEYFGNYVLFHPRLFRRLVNN